MTAKQKKLLANLGLGFGVLLGLILTMFLFMPSTDLSNYTRLEDGAGKTVEATSEGAVASTRSGRRSSTVRYCTSYVYQIDGAERHFTDKNDCSFEQENAKSGTTAQLIYDPADLGIMYVQGDETLRQLENGKSTMRVVSIVGVVMLIGSITGLVIVNKPRKSSTHKTEEK